MLARVDLRHVVYALSDALDLVGVDDYQHGKRVGVMAAEMGRAMGLDEDAVDDLFNVGLLHDCGVSSTAVHSTLVKELDWSGAQAHCALGHALLRDFPPLGHLAPIVLYHHTHWAALRREGLPYTLALQANLIFLVDRVDALAAPHYGPHLLSHTPAIRETIAGLAGDMFAPELVELFEKVSRADAFWLILEPRHVQGFLGGMLVRGMRRDLDYPGLRGIATLFSRVVDAKSPFTAAHSIGVAHLARYLGELAGLPEATRDKLEIAGLMHDLGKLQVPDEILDKQGPLSDAERMTMHRHSFESYQILRRIPGLEDIAAWAAYHHETLDGSGYPYGLEKGELPLEARIIAVADIFQALAQNRPYRPSLPADRILTDLHRRAEVGQLDPGVVGLVGRHLEVCWQRAVAGGEA